MQTKDFRMELKAVNDDGTFEGYLSVYDVVDLGNDVVEKGSFTKTIQENKGLIPLLSNHDPKLDMGLLAMSDDPYGLKVNATMFINESALAREKHAMAKRYFAAGKPVGLSIGYEAVKKVMEKGIRRLKEIKLFEGSMTLFPMLPVALMTGIKAADKKDDFLTELDEAQTYTMRYMMLSALQESLDETVWDSEMSADEKVTASDESIQQFHTAYIEFLPKLLTLRGEMETASAKARDQKTGRVLSADNRAVLEDAIQKLQALLAAADGTSAEEAAPKAAAAAATKSEPEPLHSWLSESLNDFSSRLSVVTQ